MSREHLECYETLTELIDSLNCRMYAYSEGEEEVFDSLMARFTGKEPSVWLEKDGNRQQCYSNMYSKLLLAYLICEIKAGKLPGLSIIERIKDNELDYWDIFFYDDVGYATAGALERIVEGVITYQSYFEMESDYIDLSEYDEVDGDEIGLERIRECIIKTVPLLAKCMEPKGDAIDFDSIRCFRSNFYNFEVEVETICSHLMYDINEREKSGPTEKGQWILAEGRRIFCHIMQEDYLNNGLSWTLFDDQTRMVYYFLLTCSEVLGDGSRYTGEEVFDRVHRYNYSYIYRIIELQEQMKEYEETYLL